MDLLLSVPLASYFLLPSSSLTSWSTSLNILFFYMTWTTLVMSHKPIFIHMFGLLAIRGVFWLIPSLLSLLFDLAIPSLAEGIKYGGRSALPPRDPQKLLRMLALALVNVVLVTAFEGGCSWVYTWFVGSPEFGAYSTLPLPWGMAKNIVMMFVAREVLHYYINRFILHSETSGTRSRKTMNLDVASLHDSYAHARVGAPFSLQLFTDHPLPLLLHRFVPVYLPALFLRPHLLTYFLFVGLSTMEETFAMSGYTIVPGMIMGGIAQRSALHYAGGGESNFGAWGFMDFVHGTGKGRDVLDDVRAEAENHHVKERGTKKIDQGAGILQDGLSALRDSSSDTPKRRSGRKTKSRKTD